MSSKKQRTDSASDETGNGGALATLKDGVIRYSQVWEDDALLIAGLEVAPEDDNILAIASAGDNVLNMLLAEPKEIVAVDVNPAQTALCELKMAAIKQLDHADFLTLIGYTSCEDVAQKRRDLCASLELSPELRDYWVHNDEMLTKGIASAGRLESYFRGFAEKLPSIGFPADGVSRLFGAKTLEEQAVIWQELDTPAFEKLFHSHFGKETQAKEGRSAEQLQHVEAETITVQLLARLRRMVGDVLCAENFYFRRFFDHSAPTAGSPYLLEENYARLRSLLPRVTFRTQTLQDAIASVEEGHFKKVYVSDIFEYFSLPDAHGLMETFAAAMPAGGRLAYWELYLDRPPSGEGSLQRDDKSAYTAMPDRNFFYRGFHVLTKK